MAKKSSKLTRGDQYREILESYGKRLEDCKVLAFEFETEYGPELFHYELMYPLRPVYHLFDCFVKIGDKYIDPTFERALHRDVRKEMYASCIELDPETMARYQLETGFYGDLYVYDYMCKNRPELAQQIRARNPHNRR